VCRFWILKNGIPILEGFNAASLETWMTYMKRAGAVATTKRKADEIQDNVFCVFIHRGDDISFFKAATKELITNSTMMEVKRVVWSRGLIYVVEGLEQAIHFLSQSSN
jgi:hypothetical protein